MFLELTVIQALDLFVNIPAIAERLHTLVGVGLGYIQLGQAAQTLSGGESQRLKLAKELARRSTGRSLYVLDEPTSGTPLRRYRTTLRATASFNRRG